MPVRPPSSLVPSAASVVRFQPGYRGLQRWREVLAVGAPKTSGAARKKAIVALARRLAVDPFGFAQGTRCGGSPPAGSRPGNSGSPCGHAHEPSHELTHWKKASQPTHSLPPRNLTNHLHALEGRALAASLGAKTPMNRLSARVPLRGHEQVIV